MLWERDFFFLGAILVLNLERKLLQHIESRTFSGGGEESTEKWQIECECELQWGGGGRGIAA